MAMNTLKCNHLTPRGLKGLTNYQSSSTLSDKLTMCIILITTVKKIFANGSDVARYVYSSTYIQDT